MSKTGICPVCGYDPDRDAAKHPALAKLREGAVPTGGDSSPDDVRIAGLKARIAALEEQLDRQAYSLPVTENPAIWAGEKGCIRLRKGAALPDGVAVPAVWKGEPVTVLGGFEFSNSLIRRAILPEGLTDIGRHCFEGCGRLVDIELPSTLRWIGPAAFSGCEKLERALLPDAVEAVADDTFFNCRSLREVRLPAALRTIGERAFRCCERLERIEIPAGAAVIGAEAFAGCTSLREVRLPAGLGWIEKRAFAGCSALREIEIPDGAKNVSFDAFASCAALEKVSLPGALRGLKLQLRRSCRAEYRD